MLIILAQATAFAQPSKSAFDNPACGQDFKTGLLSVPSNNLDANAKGGFTIMKQSRTVVATIQKQQFPTFKQGYAVQDINQACFILPIGGMNLNGNQPSLGINDDMPFASVDLLAAIIATCAPFSVVLTDWLSPIKTLGSELRSLAWRTVARNSALTRCQVPVRLNFWNTSYTVDQHGKSWGSIRHEQPVRSTYKIASIYSRIFSGRVRFRRSRGINCSHSLSFKSVGYAFLFSMPLVYLVISFFTNTLLIPITQN